MFSQGVIYKNHKTYSSFESKERLEEVRKVSSYFAVNK